MIKKGVVLSTLVLLTFVCLAQQLIPEPEEASLKFQKELNAEYADPEHTPLLPEDLAAFTELEFFPINLNLVFEVSIKRTPQAIPFMMKRTKDEVKYVKYGEVTFGYQGQQYTLSVYQNLDLIARRPEYSNYLFLPFTDLSNSETSYGGGRYMDLQIPEGNTLVLNFNTAYNPLCGYNKKYSCPIPPMENDLSFSVDAGVKAPKKH